MQIILIVETRASCESDYRYIKSAIDYFYVERSYKLSKVFARSKAELIRSDKKIAALKANYSGDSAVIICADYDAPNDPLNREIERYCHTHSYELVWMNVDVEEVFWGRCVLSRDKNKESIRFLTKKHSIIASLTTINIKDPTSRHPASNLLPVLDKYLKRKIH